MKKTVFLFGLVFLFINACGPSAEKEEVEEPGLTETKQSFFDHLTSLCGKKFAGQEIYMANEERSFGDQEMVIHFKSCEEDEIRIPFHIGEDSSRTWVLLVEDGNLRLRHDHRYEDGTPEERNLYGGYSDNKGTELSQYFPQDEYSKKILEDPPKHEWSFTLSEDFSTFAYCLNVGEELFFLAEFDLTKPLN